MDFKSILVQNGIQTRLVPCEIQIAFEQLNTRNEETFKKEYIALSQNRYGSITQWLNKIKSKNRTEDTDEVLLELLVELYQKVENIEQILNNRATQYLRLAGEGVAHFVGHNVLCTSSSIFEAGEKYYLRIFLPVFPQRYIGIFARAIAPQVLVFEQIGHNDLVDFDSFVVQMERLMILDSKSLSKE